MHQVTTKMKEMENGLQFELIFVDDGSKDQTLHKLQEVAKTDKEVKYLSFSRNFGKESAMFAGLENSSGDYVVIMDADLQHPPDFLPDMYNFVKSGEYDCATTRRISRKGESKIRSFFARAFYKIINRISHVEIVEGAQDFRFMSRKMVNSILELKEFNRFSKGIFSWVGFKVKYIEYENVERAAGTTAWSFWKLFLYSIDGICAFSTAPLVFPLFLGLFTLLFSIFGVVAYVLSSIFYDAWSIGVSESLLLLVNPSILCVTVPLCFLTSLVLLSMGIIGQYLAKTYTELKNRPIYIVRETEKDLK
jgi:glycosyltransferase involved in cell wall biosynthesis